MPLQRRIHHVCPDKLDVGRSLNLTLTVWCRWIDHFPAGNLLFSVYTIGERGVFTETLVGDLT